MQRSLRTASLAVLVALATTVAGCGSDTEESTDTTAPAAESTTTAADAGADEDGTTTTEAADEGDCPAATSISVTTATGTVTVDATTAYIDILGDNEGATNPQSATLTFANYAITEDDARGILMPTLTGDQVLATFSIENTGGPIEPGADYLDQVASPDSATQVNSQSIYTAAGRSLPTESHTVTFISVDDEQACGTVTPDGTSSDRAEITFVAKRIDA